MTRKYQSNGSSTLFAQERQDQILVLLQENSKIRVSFLCQEFSVSAATIRNDLRELESLGKLKRIHGGALTIEKANFEPTTKVKEIVNIETKQRIAAYAATLIEDGDTIALDSGTSTFELTKQIMDKRRITVLTNDIRIASLLQNNVDTTIVLIGGILRNGYDCTVGPTAIASLGSLTVDKAFLGTNAFTIERGFSTPDIHQAEVKKAFIRCANERTILTDSGKFGRNSLVSFASLNDVERIITDDRISKTFEKTLSESYDDIDLIKV